MGMAAIWNGEYGCGLAPAELAKICQYAENTYFGKPCGLLDQLTSVVGGVLFVDFADPTAPKIEKIHADGVLPEGMMAFGDTFNDAEMLKAAKYGFLVENGSPALREEVPFLAPPNTSSGVMQVLRRVLAQNGRVCESDFRRAK